MSNAFRDFSVVRRRPNFLDLIIPKSPTTKGYRLQAATNFDASFTTILTADISSGYLDRNINPSKIHAINNPNHIRVIFDPATFSLNDNQHIWLRYVPVDFAGSAGTAGNPSLILPDDELRAQARVIIAGTAPSAADVGASLVLNLPYRMHDIGIRNNSASGATVLYVSTAIGAPELQVGGQETASLKDGAQGCLLVRGGGGTASFSADFTHSMPV